QVEVNAFGRVIRELSRQEGQPGAEVALTVDLELQKMVSRRLGDESGAAVVMDVHNGDILALASTPSFDPNAFNKGLSADEWRALSSDPKAPLINKAIGGNFPPGSTFKMMVLLAALERGAITPQTRVFCTGELKFGDAVFHCWKKGGHGSVDAFKGVVESCDVYFYEVARRAGIDRIAAMAQRFGFGQALGVDLPGEQPGLVPTRKWKRKVMDAPWHQGETLVTGIGQGYLLATPLQMAVMTARLVNGGHAVTPRLTRPKPAAGAALPHAPAFDSLGLTPPHLALVTSALEAVVNDPHGTAYRARIKQKGFEMGGKTGTVQVRRITKAEREQGLRKQKQLRWEERDHAMFVGFAPTAAPRYTVAVVVEHGGGGASVAAPIARDILLEAQARDSAQSGILPREMPAPAQQAESDGRFGRGKG
ncbi:MAG: penicillin-binding protein 2, partial [Rhodospirillales bacterium]|nr:penicillin-binding protein 2 [Rhodospirillales bacterium]